MVFVQWSKGFRPLVHKDLSIAFQVVQWILKLLLLFDRVYACLFSFVSATEKSFKSSAKSSSATPPLAKLVWGIGDSEAVAPQLLPVRPWQLNCESHNSLTYIYLLFTCPSLKLYIGTIPFYEKKYKNSSKKKREKILIVITWYIVMHSTEFHLDIWISAICVVVFTLAEERASFVRNSMYSSVLFNV